MSRKFDDRQKLVSRTFTREEMLAMPLADLQELLGTPGAKFSGTGIVRKEDGSIRYDDDAVPGTYGESDADMAIVKESNNG